jgi:predicted site-specific integrase-resolvase
MMGDPRETEGLSTAEVAVLIGVSFRALSHWVRKGYISGLTPAGQGRPLRWFPDHIASARMVKTQLDMARHLVRDLTRNAPDQQQDQEEGERLTA